MNHLASHALIRVAVYPALYWIGYAVTKGLTLGNAIIMPYADWGTEEGAAWWEFRIRRWGYKEWRPESMIIVGGMLVLVLVCGYNVIRYLV